MAKNIKISIARLRLYTIQNYTKDQYVNKNSQILKPYIDHVCCLKIAL